MTEGPDATFLAERVAEETENKKGSNGSNGSKGSKGSIPVGDALMNQTLLMSGIGNIFRQMNIKNGAFCPFLMAIGRRSLTIFNVQRSKSEVLYAAGVSPRRGLKDVGEDEWRRIVSAAKAVSKNTLAVLGRREGESRDEYAGLRRVYGREKDPEGRHVTVYQSVDGRATYYVPSIQA